MSDNSKPYAWIKKIPITFKQLDAIPLLGDPPPFPWSELASKLTELLSVGVLEMTPSEFRWAEESELKREMGDGPFSFFEVSLPPHSGQAFFSISQNDLNQLMDQVLLKNSECVPVDEQFREAFSEFLALEIIACVSQIGYASHMTPKLVKKCSLPSEPMLVKDITATLETSRHFFRLFISSALCQSLKEHYIKAQSLSAFQHPLNKLLDMTLHIEAGATSLTQEQWKAIKPGDFLLMDRCSLKPGKNSGTVTLTLEGHPLLRGKIQDGNIEILENPLFRED